MKIRFLKVLLILGVFLIMPFGFVSAETSARQAISNNLVKVGEGPYSSAGETTLASIIGGVVKTFLGLLGIIFLILMIYAGYNWMTAAGEEAKVKKAQETIKKAIIGLIIITSAYVIYGFVSSALPGLNTENAGTSNSSNFGNSNDDQKFLEEDDPSPDISSSDDNIEPSTDPVLSKEVGYTSSIEQQCNDHCGGSGCVLQPGGRIPMYECR